MSEQLGRLVICNPTWEFVLTPVGTSPDAKACARAEKSLREQHPELDRYPAIVQARGKGTVLVELDGFRWLPENESILELQTAILDGQEVKAEMRFERSTGGSVMTESV